MNTETEAYAWERVTALDNEVRRLRRVVAYASERAHAHADDIVRWSRSANTRQRHQAMDRLAFALVDLQQKLTEALGPE